MPTWASVRWDGGAIEIVDQTRLPHSFQLVRLATVDAALDAIGRLAVRGAPAVAACGALTAVIGLDEAQAADTDGALAALDALVVRIEATRPTAVNLSWALRRVRGAATQSTSAADLRMRVLSEALRLIDEDRQACHRIGEFGRAELAGKGSLLTHCNTGRLATIGWGTALGIVYAKAAAGEPVRVFACETRPLLQGARLTAWELIDAGIDVTLVADGAAASLLASGEVDAVIVGADRITANGDTANKIGTYPLALSAHRAGVPFYVAAPWSSFDAALTTGDQVVIELRSAEEVRSWQGHASAPTGAKAWNPAFDITPHDLVAAFVTETGPIRPPFARTIAAARPKEVAG